MMQIP